MIYKMCQYFPRFHVVSVTMRTYYDFMYSKANPFTILGKC
jgi:hypothetical protein